MIRSFLHGVRAPLRTVATYVTLPLLMAVALGAASLLRARGLSDVMILNALTFPLVFVILALERLLPYREAWNRKDGQLANDIGHALLGTGLGAGLGQAITSTVMGSAGLWLAAHAPWPLWPRSLPTWLQVALVYLIADLGRYVQHRWMHVSPFWWRFHALHHSALRLTMWKTSRSHFVERIFQQMFMFGPLVLLGVPPETLMYYILPNSLLGLFDHANVDLRLGPLEYIFMSPNGHRLHHAMDPRHGMSNFGSAIVVWDHVFGTFVNPLKETPQEIGIENDTMPEGFVAQVLEPFTSSKASASTGPTPQDAE